MHKKDISRSRVEINDSGISAVAPEQKKGTIGGGIRKILVSRQEDEAKTVYKDDQYIDEKLDAKFRVKYIYEYLSVKEVQKTTSMLSKRERDAHAGLLKNIVNNTVLNVNIWNKMGLNYA